MTSATQTPQVRKREAGSRKREREGRSRFPLPASHFLLLALALLVGLGLRVFGTADLHLWGDAAYSVYAAHRDLATVATERLTDGHPPLSYYLLKLWMAVAGDEEVVVRFSSVLPGVFTIALTYRLGRMTVGPWAAVAGAWLVALNPYLVYYARMPRMYEWLACFGVLAVMLGIRLVRRPSLRCAALYALVVTAAAYTHYFGVLIPVALGPALLVMMGRRTKPLWWWLGASSAAGLLTLPWVLYAFTASRDTTGGIISNAPWPATVMGLLEQLWLVAWSGELVPLERARLLVFGATAVVIVMSLLAVAVRVRVAALKGGAKTALAEARPSGRQGISPTAGVALLLLFVAVPVLLSIPVFQQYPYFVRARFLIFLIPPLALALGALLAALWRTWRPLGALAVVVVFVATGGALRETYRLEAGIVEVESIGVMQHLAEHARPTDVAVFHAFWEQGYVAAHLHERAPVMYPLRETPLESLPGLLQRHGRLWLVMYGVEPRHPKYPAEEWLDRNAYRARSQWYGTARVLLYTRPDEKPELVNTDFGGQIALAEAWVTPRTAQPGDLIGAGLRWRAVQQPETNYTTFVHLLDARGRNRTGEDAEPMWGLTHTAEWTPGMEVVQRQGIPIPPDTPPGEYLVEAGLYRQDNGQRLPVVGGQEPDRVLLGTVRVEPGQPLAPSARRSDAVVVAAAGRIRVAGFTPPEARWQPGETPTVATVTGPLHLTHRVDPYGKDDTARLTVTWQVEQPPVPPVYSQVRIVPEGGGAPVAALPAAAALRAPASEWPVGAPLLEQFRVPLPPDAPRGRYRLEAGFAPEGALPVQWTVIGTVETGR